MNSLHCQREPVKFSAVVEGMVTLPNQFDTIKDKLISGVSLDSRKVTTGDIFLGFPGAETDGRQFAEAAMDNNAEVILFEAEQASEKCLSMQQHGTAVGIKNLRSKASLIAGRIYGHPSRKLHVTGITGTNGKTTCAFLLVQALEILGFKSAMLGTIGSGFLHGLTNASLTTGDAVETQKRIADLLQQGATAVTMEVSSHGLAQDRAAALDINIAVLTNLAEDHIDYHGSVEAYAEAKRKLFDFDSLEGIVLNVMDEFGKSIYDELSEGGAAEKVITYGQPDADLYATDIVSKEGGLRFDLHFQQQVVPIHTRLFGQFNVFNLLAVSAVLLKMDYSLTEIAATLKILNAPPGRMEQFAAAHGGATAVVDYSHTADSLEKALDSLNHHCMGDIWVVFGCGGDRDVAKREKMGQVAAKLADHVVVTNDNPRSESPEKIAERVLIGIHSVQNPRCRSQRIILEREVAITYAIKQANKEDWVLVAGKGHETTQTIGNLVKPFDDRKIVAELQQKAKRALQ